MQSPYGMLGSRDIAEAFTEVLCCLAQFILIWITLFIVRKILNQKDYFVKRRNLRAAVYLAVLAFFFYSHFVYAEIQVGDKPYVYQKIYDFWLSVIPEFRLEI